MRKTRFDSAILDRSAHAPETWLDLDRVSQVAVTSEDPAFPVESVFRFDSSSGWRAGGKGEQTIRLTFDPPQRITRIRLRFVETDTERTQEFSLRWRRESNGLMKKIVRQQWNFSPGGSTTEIEDYEVDLDGVGILELTITPDISNRGSVASLAEWRVA